MTNQSLPGSNNVDEMLDKLNSILPRVDEWLKYAEAKNAILLGFSGAAIAAVITYLSSDVDISNSIKTGFIITTIILSLCSLICAISFLPRTDLEAIVWKKKNPKRREKGSPSDEDNLYYFGHLYKYQGGELVEAINKLYLNGSITDLNKKEYNDLSSQIVINSEITYLKLRIFSWALYALIFSILSTPSCIIISLLIKNSF